ncbi:MAG: DUF411 domain-containing protein, partial [Longimicrobiales bacterium]|nr:DUF411 domain-containing protein [Longimicrobiales bacterium]
RAAVAAARPAEGSGVVAAAAVAATPADPALPTIVVYKTEGCGCCNGWIEHLQAAGFTVDARNVTDLMTVKRDAGVPAANSSCHTALVDGYVVEGHVPADLVKKMLAERPDVAGLAVPGMPVGSPGMEGPGAKPFQVLTFDRQGTNTVYATVNPR